MFLIIIFKNIVLIPIPLEMPQIYLIRRMHYLASRFIRVKNKNVNELHVIDPYLDFRQRFENLEKLKDMLRLRKICNHEMHVEEIAANYNRWWDSFRTYENNSDVRFYLIF